MSLFLSDSISDKILKIAFFINHNIEPYYLEIDDIYNSSEFFDEIPLNEENYDKFNYDDTIESFEKIFNSNGLNENLEDDFGLDSKNLYKNNIKINLESKSLENNIEIISKKKLFKSKYIKKRGRQTSSNSSMNKQHKNSDPDNIQTKIQVHFITFLTNLANDAIKVEYHDNKKPNKKYSKKFFKQIKYDVKKKIEHNHLTNIFKEPIKNIILNGVSTKYKNFGEDFNKKLFKELVEESDWLKKFLDMKFIEVFNKYYYNNEQPLKIINFNGKNIKVSDRTNSFSSLLSKEKNLTNQITDLVRDVYLWNKKDGNQFIIVKKDN